MNALRRYVDWLSDSFQPAARPLAIVRIAFAAYVIFYPHDYLWVAQVPSEFFHPAPGPASLLSGPPPLWFVLVLEIARIVVAIWLAVGRWTTVASVSLTVVLLTGSAVVYSFSKIDHFILFDLAPVALAAAGWGAAFSADAALRRRRGDRPGLTRGFPVFIWGMFVAFALFTAALPKGMAGWLSPSHHGTLSYVATDVAENVLIGPLAPFLIALDLGAWWKLLDYATVLAEGWLILALLSPGLFRIGLLVLSVFHVGVYLTLGIDFSAYFFVYAVFFCRPWRTLWPELGAIRRVDRRPSTRAAEGRATEPRSQTAPRSVA